LRCNQTCSECEYYLETYAPRIDFIHQIDFPAAIYQGLYLWAGNGNWAKLFNVSETDLVGMGVDEAVHAESLDTVISYIKKRSLGDEAPVAYPVIIKTGDAGRARVRVSVYPLMEPDGTYLLAANPEEEYGYR